MGGVFTADQLDAKAGPSAGLGLIPARGVIEVKPLEDDAWVTADSKQVSRYWNKYRLVLVTNFRSFLLLGADYGINPSHNFAVCLTVRPSDNSWV